MEKQVNSINTDFAKVSIAIEYHGITRQLRWPYPDICSLDKIDTNLYLSGIGEASSVTTLRKYKITHILTINDFPLSLEIKDQLSHLNIKFIRLSDVCNSDLLSHFDETYEFIRDGVHKGAVLVHCQMGLSRSATVVIAYMMKKYNLTCREALDRVKRKRMVFPNMGFLSQLERYKDMGYSTMHSLLSVEKLLLEDATLTGRQQNSSRRMFMLGNKCLLHSFRAVIPLFASTQKFVTCGSVLKLLNTDYRVRLHSHDVKYGTGSGQQSVTGTEIQEDINSHWLVKGGTGKTCERGQPIKCGSVIRLEHVETKKNLHSHNFQSPLSGNQEISCYGDSGEGDSGDNWTVVCSGDSWRRDDSVMLKHVDTQMYLAISGRTFGRPINGQMEVIGLHSSSGSVHWQTAEGVFLHAVDLAAKHMHSVHTEL
ncbi:unnamed protein product [Phaedon cochleariae]|uniref:Protein-tyrosine-phosphatase n=1 Tax=Phaedon cochleariae TaxID=80249 RepID=A0A9N9X5H7_PHACE|nr:unnamed protein product [Phaedon cochleariae]